MSILRSSRPGRFTAPGVLLAVFLPALPAPAGAGGDEEALVIGRPEALVVTPTAVTLSGRRDARQLRVSGRYEGGAERDLTHLAAVTADDPGIVAVGPHGHVTPRADGRTALRVRAGGREATVPVIVTGFERPDPVSFRREVVAALNVSDCNSGGCHGTPSGKNGFKLSLRGFDPAADHLQLTRDLSGRRVNLSDPDASLILLKGQGRVPHEGGSGSGPMTWRSA